jgi:hypothetical protein
MLDRGTTDTMYQSQFSLADPAIVDLKDLLQSISLGRSKYGTYAIEMVAKVAPTGFSMVLGHRQVQYQQTVALASVFKITFACGLDPHRRSRAVNAGRPCAELGPNVDVFLTT